MQNQQLDGNNLPAIRGQGESNMEMVAYDGNYERVVDEDEIDLRALWRTVMRFKKLIATIFVMVVLSALVVTLLMRPTYTASILMEVNTGGRNLVKFQNLEEQDNNAREYLITQSKILESDAVARKVIDNLELEKEPEFTGELSQRGLLTGLRSIVRLILPNDQDKLGEEQLQLKLKKGALSRYLKRVSVSSIRNSSLVRVNFESFTPELSAKIANVHGEAYIALSDQRRFNSTSGAKNFLEKEISNVQARLETSEKQLTDFARKNGVIDVEDRNNIMLSRLSELNQALAEVQNDRIDAETQFTQSKSAEADQLVVVFDDALIKNLREQQAQLQSEYFELAKIYKPKYPRMEQLKAKIDELESSISDQAAKITGGLETRYDQLVLRENRLIEELDKLKQQMLNLQDRAVTYNILKREWESNKELYSGLLERTKEVGIAAGMELNVASVVDVAKVPERASSPNLILNIAIASVLGLMAGLGTAFLLAMLDNSVNDVEQLHNVAKVGHLGVIPDAVGSGEEFNDAQLDQWVHGNPQSNFSESVQSLRTSLTYSQAGGMPKSLMITSSMPGEGKTTVAINLALSVAKSGKRVIVVEADLRKPRHAKIFGKPSSPGLTDLLVAGEVFLPYKVAEVDGLEFLVAGSNAPNPVDLLGSLSMKDLITGLEQEYDLVLIDCPPVLGLADAIIVSSLVQGVVFVAAAHQTPKDAIKNSINRLRLANATIVGSVLNKLNANSAGYGDDYYSYYGDINEVDHSPRT